jgi:hypothetical protein
LALAEDTRVGSELAGFYCCVAVMFDSQQLPAGSSSAVCRVQCAVCRVLGAGYKMELAFLGYQLPGHKTKGQRRK